ncbi:U4/U6.U5 small nuclear ribonucleoprotein 27 kDa protein-like [Zophobas morio]|uniref:U4/U6.U5 small nuclear ribonucleoprotein 27 kDa protein-like n=1 Tax=Zophobas morio TaxID=2755281 RepID=UPI0030831875
MSYVDLDNPDNHSRHGSNRSRREKDHEKERNKEIHKDRYRGRDRSKERSKDKRSRSRSRRKTKDRSRSRSRNRTRNKDRKTRVEIDEFGRERVRTSASLTSVVNRKIRRAQKIKRNKSRSRSTKRRSSKTTKESSFQRSESSQQKNGEGELESDDEAAAMYKLLGFNAFSSTHGKKIDGADISAVGLSSKRKYRQYMHRRSRSAFIHE